MKKPQTIGKTDQWPADQIVKRQVADLTPYARNSRQHSQAQIAQIAASIKEWGWTQPIIIDDEGGILAGHGRLLAAQHLGLAEVPCVVATGWSEAKRRAYVIADNRLAELAQWDQAMLATELQDLSALDFDLALVGFDGEELARLLEGEDGAEDGDGEGSDTAPEIDRAEELRQKWGVETGQLWQLGEHRLLCGDSTKAEDVARVMGGDQATLVVTDPPYGVSYADKNAFLNAVDKGNSVQTAIANDHLSKEATQELWRAAFAAMASAMGKGAVVYCFHAQVGNLAMLMMQALMDAGIEPRHELIWLKNNHVLGRTDYAYKHEPILYAWKDGGHKFYGDFQTSILEFARPQKSDLHPTMKPVPLIERLIANSSQEGEAVYEPFLGSGTTLIACENLNRRCRAIEISPAYVAVALERWHQHTGRTPVLLP